MEDYSRLQLRKDQGVSSNMSSALLSDFSSARRLFCSPENYTKVAFLFLLTIGSLSFISDTIEAYQPCSQTALMQLSTLSNVVFA